MVNLMRHLSCRGLNKIFILSSSSSSSLSSIHRIHPLSSSIHQQRFFSSSPFMSSDDASYIREKKKSMNRVIIGFIIAGSAVYGIYSTRDVKSFVFPFSTFLMLKTVEPETAHHAVMLAARGGLLPNDYDKDDPSMKIRICGMTFANPIGLAAGFDKNAEAPLEFLKMGFGFVEVGTVTPEPQEGNATPRIFRLPEDKAVINRCGFNNDGVEVVRKRMMKISEDRWNHHLTSWGIVGVNVGKNRSTPTSNASDDVRTGIRSLGGFGDYLVLNVSSPNTPGLRCLQEKKELAILIDAAKEEIQALSLPIGDEKKELQKEEGKDIERTKLTDKKDTQYSRNFPTQSGYPPKLFIKVAPDLTEEEKKDIAEVIMEKGVDGLIVSNTTISRPSDLQSANKNETGGLSGIPLKSLATQCVSDFYRYTNGKVPIIASGGVASGSDALEKIEAGASLVQIYTSMIYGGPGTARRIKDELSYLLYKKGYHSIEAAVGAKHKNLFKLKKKLKPTFD